MQVGNQDSLSLALRIETAVAGKILPAKLKDWISGCPRCCGKSQTRDIRVMETNRGWTVIFGGNSGTRPRIGNVVARDFFRWRSP
jgi:NAD(P)H-nitrite reductase large subunit